MDMITYHIDHYDKTLPLIQAQADSLHDRFFSATALLDNLK
jgi:hypothetical protein